MTTAIADVIAAEPTLLAGFDRTCEDTPDRRALVFLGTGYRYADLRAMAERFATGCRSLGLNAGDRVLIYLPNCPQWLVAYLGLQRMGAVPVPVSPIYTPRELRYLLEDSGARMVVCADTNFGYVDEVAADTGVDRIVVTRLTDLLPAWKRLVGWLFDKVPTGSVRWSGSVVPFTRLLRGAAAVPGPAVDPARDLAHILYTGGTTGFPKGVPHTHRELVSGIVAMREAYRQHIGNQAHTLVVPLALFHMFTQDMLFALGLHLGNTVVVLPKPRTDAVLAAVRDHAATMLIGVPSLYRFLLDNERLDFYHCATLAHCWSAGDVLPQETARRWQERFGMPIHQVYGSTETVCISLTSLDRAPDPAQVGRVIPTREVAVVDPDTLEDVPAGTPGELLVSSPYAFGAGGYWNAPKETEQTYVRRGGRLWCRTGDYVTGSESGDLAFVDRRADLIKHKGNRVSASRVESVLQDHPAVVAACVVGAPNPDTGEAVKAFVILDSDARGVTAYELVRHCRERLLPYEVPEYVEFRDMLPKSKVGKLLRRELKEEERRRSAAEGSSPTRSRCR